MNLQARIHAFTQLGKLLNKDFYKEHEKTITQASVKNTWFTIKNVKVKGHAKEVLNTLKSI